MKEKLIDVYHLWTWDKFLEFISDVNVIMFLIGVGMLTFGISILTSSKEERDVWNNQLRILTSKDSWGKEK